MTAISRPRAAILTIGNELLRGTVLNTNATFFARELTTLGFDVCEQSSCCDEEAIITQKLQTILETSDIAILSGGLGPTPDDLTRDAVANFLNVPLVLSQRQLTWIQNHYKRRKQRMPELVRKEALFPKGAVPLFNHHGIALGFLARHDGKGILVLPGVPYEAEKMFFELVIPLLRREFPALRKKPALIIKTAGISEPEVMQRLKPDFFNERFDFGIYPGRGEVALRLYCEDKAVLTRLKAKARMRLQDSVYAWEEATLSESVGKILIRKKLTLAVAESCTAGLLAAEIAKVSGASRYLIGGVVAYNNRIKTEFLDVRLGKRGAVSKETATALASNVRKKMKTDWGIGITGIAGPTGGTKDKPVGTVFIAIASKCDAFVWKEHFWGSRDQIRSRAVQKTLERLWRLIR